MRALLPRSPAHRIIFLAGTLLALVFALYTQHVWEDYYITYRSSRNLATGHGLVYNLGDRLHTFTSPLGVLLPALASLLTLNRSDDGALWLFRLMSIAAFAGAAVLAYATFRCTRKESLAAALLASVLLLDAKSLDFTINGMETGFLLFFLAGALYAQFVVVEKRWLGLGLAWAGLMWTRPDGFIYVALLAAGGWLFHQPTDTQTTRRDWVRVCLLAGLVCTLAYLPWFAGSWVYYGTPVPHTIVAKSALTEGQRPLLGLLQLIATLPVRIWTGDTSLPGAFLPAYYMIGGWPAALVWLGKLFAFLAAFAWLVPALGAPVRTASFAFLGFQVYLSFFPYFPFPWYQPGTTLLADFALAGLVAQSWSWAGRGGLARVVGGLGVVLAGLMVGIALWTAPAVARQFAAQQALIENHNRRRIGEWLHEHAQRGDTVFLEPLGYIGYFSGLKTYDFPGMSSREVPALIRQVGPSWTLLIEELQPDWLVLRQSEIDRLTRERPSLLSAYYHPVKEFDARTEVQRLTVRGRPLLETDARFVVFQREQLKQYQTELGTACSRFDPAIAQIAGRHMVMVHAPSEVKVPLPPNAKSVSIACGFVSGAGQGEPKSDGVTFNVRLHDGGRRPVLAGRVIRPAEGPDPHVEVIELALPPHSAGAELILQADPGASSVKDWSCWGVPTFK